MYFTVDDVIKLKDKECLVLFDQDISFIVEKYEDIEDPTGPLIIQPDKPKNRRNDSNCLVPVVGKGIHLQVCPFSKISWLQSWEVQ